VQHHPVSVRAEQALGGPLVDLEEHGVLYDELKSLLFRSVLFPTYPKRILIGEDAEDTVETKPGPGDDHTQSHNSSHDNCL
jgi:hypothetical protein